MSELVLSDLSQKGEEIYDSQIKQVLPPNLEGKIIAIEVESGNYFIGDTVLKAGLLGREKYPNSQFYFKRIGYRTVHKSVGIAKR